MPPSPIQPDGGTPYALPPEAAAGPRSWSTDDFQLFLDHIWDQLFMEPMGGDPVSHDVARAVTYRMRDAEDSYFNVLHRRGDRRVVHQEHPECVTTSPCSRPPPQWWRC